MDRDEQSDVISAFLLASLLAIGVIIAGNWDRIRCYLPEMPTIRHVSTGSGPTLIDGD